MFINLTKAVLPMDRKIALPFSKNMNVIIGESI